MYLPFATMFTAASAAFAGLEVWISSSAKNTIAIHKEGSYDETKGTRKWGNEPIIVRKPSELAEAFEEAELDFGDAPYQVSLDYVSEHKKAVAWHTMVSVGTRQFNNDGTVTDPLGSAVIREQEAHPAEGMNNRWRIRKQYPRCQLAYIDYTELAETLFPIYQKYTSRNWHGPGLEPGYSCGDFAFELQAALCDMPAAKPVPSRARFQLGYHFLNLHRKTLYYWVRQLQTLMYRLRREKDE